MNKRKALIIQDYLLIRELHKRLERGIRVVNVSKILRAFEEVEREIQAMVRKNE